jgi:hypothetical protein
MEDTPDRIKRQEKSFNINALISFNEISKQSYQRSRFGDGKPLSLVLRAARSLSRGLGLAGGVMSRR